LEIIISDDDPQRLQVLSDLKAKIKVKTCVLVQLLSGVHSIVDAFDLSYLNFRERVVYKLSRFVPFALLRKSYKGLLVQQNVIIANSQITATLLHTLYGIAPHGVIYPAVDTEIFKQSDTHEEGNKILLYLGSHAGDTDRNFIKKVCKTLQNMECETVVFGNRRLQQELKGEFNIATLVNVSDQILARTYSQCRLTLCPQKWEMFGYVVAESISCNTPVLAFNLMGPAEIIMQTKQGFLADNEEEFLRVLENFWHRRIKIENQKQENLPWHMSYSTSKLNNVIRVAVGNNLAN
jgi:glycosyltransferase involved in cell wall biosynthesis